MRDKREEAGKATSIAALLRAKSIQCEIGLLLYPFQTVDLKAEILSFHDVEPGVSISSEKK